jgi:2-keto-4-pentenoate hydratase
MLNGPQVERAVDALMRARHRHEPLAAYPAGANPRTLDDAYAIQEAFTRRWSSSVAGYKVGCASAESQRLVGAPGPIAGRVYAKDSRASPATVRARDFFKVGVEGEFAFRLGRDFAPEGTPSREETAAAVAEVVCAIEICDTRLADWKAAGLHAMVADNGFHGGLVLGPSLPLAAAPDLAEHEIALSVDGAVKGRGPGRLVLGHPLDSLAWLAGELSRQGHPLRAGDIVAAGTCTGLHFVTAPARIVADFGTMGRVDMNLVA